MPSMLLEDQIARNKRQTVYVVVLMFLIMTAMVYAIAVIARFFWFGGSLPLGFAAVIAVFAAALYILVTYNMSVAEVIRATEARPVNMKVREEKLLAYKVEELSIAAGLSKPPKVYVQESKDINAFAAGKKVEEAIICVSTGAMAQLNGEEMEGVLAHELSHILNRDVLLATVTVGVVGAIALMAEILVRMAFYGSLTGRGGRGGKGGAGQIVIVLVAIFFAILAPLFARMTYLAMSRKREYLADSSGAYLTRNPGGLASALRKIQGDLPDDPKGSKTAASLYIANPWKRALKDNLWSTHPPLEERIRRLERR
ncbi:MAG: M48 family metallopeptidase [Euryarchaeota archaeon]|nr:M48 family metallopeptidase [Euryarchaeota archaeon]